MKLNEKWESYKQETLNCNLCRSNSNSIIDKQAFPLFMNNNLQNTDILFILEAPNSDDTYNQNKGYITIDNETDPSGKFFYELYTEILGKELDDLFITNSVLCLPKKDAKRKHTVTNEIRKNCVQNITKMINGFQPRIVCTLGKKALDMLKLIENHKCNKLSECVGKQFPWFGRILFPLYHTGLLARKPPYGRSKEMQRNDWKILKELMED